MSHPLTQEGERILQLLARKYECIRTDYDELSKLLYVDNEECELCWAKVKGDKRCSRRRRLDKMFCGNHLRSQPFGCINTDKIATWIDEDLGSKYLIDQNNNVYTNNPLSPELIGKKIDGRLVYH